MHGLINRFKAHPGKRDALATAMLMDAGPLRAGMGGIGLAP